MKIKILYILLILSPILGQGQNPYFQVIDRTNGLPSNSVYDLFQDKRGFIWITSDEGLSRYDGYSFRTYNNNSQNSKAGSCIREDKYGRIWYENFDGNLFYIEDDSLKTIEQNQLGGFQRFAFLNNRLLAIQKNTINLYDLKTLKIINQIKYQKTIVATAQSKDRFYIITDSLLSIDQFGKVYHHKSYFKTVNYPSVLAEARNEIILADRNNINKKCYALINGTFKVKFDIISPDFILNIAYTDDQIWFCSKNGVFAFDSIGNQINSNPYFINKNISDVIKDREGNYWFSSLDNGIYFVSSLALLQIDINNIDVQSIGKINDKTSAIGSNNNEIFTIDEHFKLKKITKKLPNNHKVYYLNYDSIGNQILYTSSTFNAIGLSTKTNHLNNIPISVKEICRIDRKYFAYAGTGSGGLFYFDPQIKSSWDNFYNSKHKSSLWKNANVIIPNSRIRSVTYSKYQQSIYFASGNGLYKATSKKITEITHQNKPVFIRYIYSYGNFQYALDMQKQVLMIDSNDQINYLNNLLQSAYRIKLIKVLDNFLFVIADNGVFYADLQVSKIKFKNLFIDIAKLEIKDFSFQNKCLLLVSNIGLLKLDLLKANHDLPKPILIINQFSVNANITTNLFSEEFDFQQNNIEISYSILSFKSGSKYPLYYQINSKEWQLASDDARILRFSSLSPGQYLIKFHLGELNNKTLNDQIITFKIKEPFWMRLWFIVSMALLFALSIFIYYQNRVKALNKRNQLLTENILLEQNLDRATLASIRSQMNPHFFFNALNTIQSFIYKNDKENAVTYLSKFSKLTRIILEFSEKETISLEEEIFVLTLYLELENARFNNEIDFSISSSDDLDIEMIRIPVMLIQPFVENAIKHGLLHKNGEKKLFIEFTQIENRLVIIIDDNGVGRKKSSEIKNIKQEKYNSFSTSANLKRVDLLNKKNKNIVINIFDKTNEKNEALGTKVIISISLINNKNYEN